MNMASQWCSPASDISGTELRKLKAQNRATGGWSRAGLIPIPNGVWQELSRHLLSRPSGTLSSILNGGEGWGEEAHIGEATGAHSEMV